MMLQQPLARRTTYPWRQNDRAGSPFHHFVGKAPDGGVPSAQTTTPIHRPPVSSSRRTASTATAAVAVPHHLHPEVSGGWAAAASASVTASSGSNEPWSSSAAARMAVTTPRSSHSPWWILDSAPPRHTRSLYATIPLPTEDWPHDAEDDEMCKPARRSKASLALSSSCTAAPPPPNPNPNDCLFTSRHPACQSPHPLQLHPSLQNASLSSSPASGRSPSPRVASARPSTDWTRHRNAPATTPSVGQLTVTIESTGRTFCVHPTSPISPGAEAQITRVLVCRTLRVKLDRNRDQFLL
ncbi:hypothetical protein LshimejAT787_1105390 [Lyophyllum shimeji]|uniref:Uncharacterized protein n=1 Tax=Lyophyllum shimeji TaxID=47721 RepID=A0A9P3PW03_LYOSH|nr:hypothetical protein LshimejAT787_1105390 [Lyophyllum shimeji]